MENGVYIAEHVMLCAKRKICVFSGRFTIYTMNGNYVATMDFTEATKHFGPTSWWKKEEKRNKLYNIAWMIDGVIKETICVNATYPVVKWKINQMKSCGYNTGLLMLVPSNLS